MNFRSCLTVLITFVIFLLPGFMFAQGGWTWAKSFGNKGYDNVRDIVATPSGNTYITGYCNDTTDFNPDPIATYYLDSYYSNDFLYVVKLDMQGEFLWAFGLSDTSSIKGEVITLDSDENIIVGGRFGQTVDFDPDSIGVYEMNANNQEALFIAKYDSTGDFQWAKAFRGAYLKYINAVSTDSYGNIYATGIMYDSIDFNPDPLVDSILVPPGYSTLYFFKLDSAGNFCWAHMLEGNFVYGWDIHVDSNDDILILGETSDTLDMDPSLTGTDIFPYMPFSFGDAFFAKYTSDGNYIWGRQLFSWDTDQVYNLTTDLNNDILISGDFAGMLELLPGNDTLLIGESSALFGGYVSKFNPSGNHIWSKQLPSWSDFVPHGIQTDMLGNIYTTGIFEDSADFNPDTLIYNWLYSEYDWDVYLSVLDSSGNYISAISGNGKWDEAPENMTMDHLGNVYITGWFVSDTLCFGNDTVFKTYTTPSTSTDDIFIAKAGNFLTGLHEPASASTVDFNLYPNPANEYFMVSTTGQPSKLTVSDITGKCLISIPVTDSTSVSVQDLTPGIYLVTMTSQYYSATKKLVITAY